MFLKDDLIIFIEKDISEIDIGPVKDEQEHWAGKGTFLTSISAKNLASAQLILRSAPKVLLNFSSSNNFFDTTT